VGSRFGLNSIKEKNILHLPGIEPRILVSIPTGLSRLLNKYI
jgi:hypothetical protein